MLSTATSEATGWWTGMPAILVVDDDDDIAESLTLVLEAEGYAVQRVPDAREAIEHLENTALPALILLDLVMPRMNGWEFLVLQRGEPAWTDIPVIAISADHSAQAAAVDADAYLRKPIDANVLLSTVDTLLSVAREKRGEAHRAELDRLSALGILAAGVAHEINNPLAFLIGNLELAQQHMRELEPELEGVHQARLLVIEELMQRIDVGAQRIADIVRSVSAYSRSDTESEAAIDVVEALNGSIQLVENELRHHAQLSRQVGGAPRAHGNAAQLGQVFVNLLTTAIHAVQSATDPPEIRVTVCVAADGGAKVTIADNGAGIAPPLISHAFDPFFSTKALGGDGLGLAISQRIVASMGGTLSVESELGKGSVFCVHLPPSARAKRERGATSPIVPERARLPKVLVIDDEPLMCELLAALLGEAYEVNVCVEGRNALAGLVEGESYDAILCDLMMPGFSGMELYAQLTRDRPDQAARMVFMTGGTFTERAQLFIDGLHGDYLAKPFRPPEVLAILENRLAALGLVGAATRHAN